jgi:hypothetical protein
MSERDMLELNQLAYRYAYAVDTLDEDAFAGVFAPDGRLKTYHPDEPEPFASQQGREALAGVPRTMRGMYRKTAHLMTNHLIELDGDRASGSLLCTARHLWAEPTNMTVLTVVIRYLDRYIRLNGAWFIEERQIRFLWSENTPCVDSGFMR